MFLGANRGISYYVPLTYDSTQDYKLVVGLHGCFSNGAAYRTTLQNLSDSLDAIILAPDGPYDGTGWMLGTEAQIIRNSIDTTRMNYSINDSCVYLTGFSCNGAVTYKEGLAPVYPFAGIIPFNSGNIANLKPFNTNSKITTCICSGTLDNNYASNQTEYNNLVAAGVDVYFNSIPGVGHTTAFPTFDAEMMECFYWIDSIKADTNTTATIFPATPPQLRIFPNPSAGTIFIQSLLPPGGRISISDGNGSVCRKYVSQAQETSVKLDHGLPGGMYFLTIESAGHRVTQKLLVK